MGVSECIWIGSSGQVCWCIVLEYAWGGFYYQTFVDCDLDHIQTYYYSLKIEGQGVIHGKLGISYILSVLKYSVIITYEYIGCGASMTRLHQKGYVIKVSHCKDKYI